MNYFSGVLDGERSATAIEAAAAAAATESDCFDPDAVLGATVETEWVVVGAAVSCDSKLAGDEINDPGLPARAPQALTASLAIEMDAKSKLEGCP